MSIEPVDLGELVGEAIAIIEPMAQQHGVTIDSSVDGVIVGADRNRARQVLLNLLSNAVKYNRPGGTVSVQAQIDGDECVLRVEDSGRGIAPEDLPRLFQPFERLGVDEASAQGAVQVEGNGIGLALTRGLVEIMGGAITVESDLGVGTSFLVRLPTMDPQAEGAVVSTGRGTSEYAEDATVLYIEDNPSNTVLVETALALRPSITLLTAAQGLLGFDLAKDHRPDLILLDLHLPDIPGERVLAMLKADADTADVPVLVVSADATERRIKDVMAAGAAAYITKPMVIADFLTSVDRALAGVSLSAGELT
jgi:CheY-like chemotaxis protein